MPAKKKGSKAKHKPGAKGKAVMVAEPSEYSGQEVQKKKSGPEAVERQPRYR